MRGTGGPPLFFVHGFACDATDWTALLDRFAAKATVVACDLPGHGRSPGTAAECTVKCYGAQVGRALAELPLPPAILIGHSMGCRVVLEAARVRPDAVAGLVLIDGSRIAVGDTLAAANAMADELRGDGYRLFVRKFFDAMFIASSDPALARAITERALRLPASIGSALMTDLAGWDAGDAVSALAAVGVRLLAIQSTTMDSARERVPLQAGGNSPWLNLIRATVPDAAIVTLPGASHFPQIDQADAVADLIDRFVWPDRPS